MGSGEEQQVEGDVVGRRWRGKSVLVERILLMGTMIEV